MWWLEGVERGWNGAGNWSRMPGWGPLTEPVAGLTLYPDDGMDIVGAYTRWLAGAEDRARREAKAAAARREAEIAQLWEDRDSEPGATVLYAARAGRLPWEAELVMEDFGADFGKSIRKWQRAARGGSERCLLLLQRLDLLVKRSRAWVEAVDLAAVEADLERTIAEIERVHDEARAELYEIQAQEEPTC